MEQEYSGLIVQQAVIGKNICFTLSGEEAFSRTRYKMMQGMLSSGLLPCILYRYNGMPKLMYAAQGKKQLLAFGEMGEAAILGVVRGVLEAAQTLLEAEFLNFDNVLCDMSSIFADPQSMECGFIFLPLNNAGESVGREKFEKKLIEILRSFIVRRAVQPGAGLRTISAEAARADMTVQQMIRVVKMMDMVPETTELLHASMSTGCRLVLVGKDRNTNVKLPITKPEFIVGRSVNGVDGTISFNPAISRVHCKFIQDGMKTYIADMGSSGGTYVNGVRIGEGQAVPVQSGDKIQLANSVFVLQEG